MMIPFITEEARLLILKYEAATNLINQIVKMAADNAYNDMDFINSWTLLKMIEKYRQRVSEIDRTGR